VCLGGFDDYFEAGLAGETGAIGVTVVAGSEAGAVGVRVRGVEVGTTGWPDELVGVPGKTGVAGATDCINCC
jgi:hypothetical protein